MHVDAAWRDLWDAGSIPAASKYFDLLPISIWTTYREVLNPLTSFRVYFVGLRQSGLLAAAWISDALRSSKTMHKLIRPQIQDESEADLEPHGRISVK